MEETCEEAPEEIKILSKGPMMHASTTAIVLMDSVSTQNPMMREDLFKIVGLLWLLRQQPLRGTITMMR